MSLWTLRHPPVDRQGRCVGQAIIETTMPHVEAVAQAMEAAPFRPTRLFSSDLPRCANLADGLARAWSIPLRVDPRLREMHFGEWEGRSYDALDSEDSDRWRHWCANWQTAAPPGGEALAVFVDRIIDWLDNCDRTPSDAVVTHAGVIRVFRTLGGATWDEAMRAETPFLGWTVHSLD